MTTQWTVELRGECREVYVVDADTENEARENWFNGFHQITEAFGMEVESVTRDDA